MKTLLRLFGKFTRWYIILIIFIACPPYHHSR